MYEYLRHMPKFCRGFGFVWGSMTFFGLVRHATEDNMSRQNGRCLGAGQDVLRMPSPGRSIRTDKIQYMKMANVCVCVCVCVCVSGVVVLEL